MNVLETFNMLKMLYLSGLRILIVIEISNANSLRKKHVNTAAKLLNKCSSFPVVL